jgi:hypothetical protein
MIGRDHSVGGGVLKGGAMSWEVSWRLFGRRGSNSYVRVMISIARNRGVREMSTMVSTRREAALGDRGVGGDALKGGERYNDYLGVGIGGIADLRALRHSIP